MALTVQMLEDIAGARAQWGSLAERGANVFGSWEWAEAWWRHYGAGRELRLAACRRPDGRLAGILPLYVSTGRPVRILRFLGHGQGDQLGPICAPEDRPAVAQALRSTLEDELSTRGLFLGERLWGDDRWRALIGGAVLRREASPVLPVGGRSFDEFLASRSKNFREQVRRRPRKLAREFALTIRLAGDPERLDEDFGTLVRLHQARRPGSLSFAGRAGRFHRDFAARALERGWLRLWILELDHRPAAAWYGLRYGGIEFYYQAGRDPSLDRHAVGFVLLCHSIRAAFDDGMDEYRFGLGPEPYKDRFAERDPGLESLVIGSGARARLAVAAALQVRHLPPRMRRSLIGRLAG